MKHNHNHDNSPGAGPQLVPVRFEFTHPTASAVCLAGTFNDWNAKAKPMHPVGSGRWVKETVLQPGTYEYCLVVDGDWIADPRALKTVANPFGGRNSILEVADPTQAAHLADEENLPLKHVSHQKTQRV